MIPQTQLVSLDELLALIAHMSNSAESTRIRDAMAQFKEYAPDSDYQTVRRALSERLNEIADAGEQEMQRTADIMRINGVTYNLGNWLTIANYANKYGLDTHVLTNWIRRQTIPPDCVLTIPALNHIRMIKDQPYKS